MKDYYKILGLSESSTKDEIKEAYRRLSRKFHPDKHSGDKDMERIFAEVNEAYEYLSKNYTKSNYSQSQTPRQEPQQRAKEKPTSPTAKPNLFRFLETTWGRIITVFIVILIIAAFNDDTAPSNAKPVQVEIFSSKAIEASDLGIMKIRGYVTTELVNSCYDCEPGKSPYPDDKYVFFHIVSGMTDALSALIKDKEGNAFFKENEIGLGCVVKASTIAAVIPNGNQLDNYELDTDASKTILQSSIASPITLSIYAPKSTLEIDVPDCFSDFKITSITSSSPVNEVSTSNNFLIVYASLKDRAAAIKYASKVYGRVFDSTTFNSITPGIYAVVNRSFFNNQSDAEQALEDLHANAQFKEAYIKNGGDFNSDPLMTEVRHFYLSLENGDGAGAVKSLVPEKRETGHYTTDGLTKFWSNQDEPLLLLDVAPTSEENVMEAFYKYKPIDKPVCEDSAKVYLEKSGDGWLISKILPEKGC